MSPENIKLTNLLAANKVADDNKKWVVHVYFCISSKEFGAYLTELYHAGGAVEYLGPVANV